MPCILCRPSLSAGLEESLGKPALAPSSIRTDHFLGCSNHIRTDPPPAPPVLHPAPACSFAAARQQGSVQSYAQAVASAIQQGGTTARDA